MLSSERHLTGKTAWVTGSSRGIGKVVAAHLASLGARVAVHGTSPLSARAFNEGDSLDSVAAAIATENGVETLPVHGDLANPDDVKRIATEIRARFGQIDILVNVAGGDIGAGGTAAPSGGRPQSNDALFISLDDLRSVLDRNLMTCILACREVAPEMMERRSGRIVTFSSVAGLVGRVEGATYCTAKAAVNEYTRCLAAQLRPYNVQVNAIAPGQIITPRLLASRQVDPSAMVQGGTLERSGWPIEIAAAVEFLVADSNSYMTGQVLRIDGGEQLWPA